MMHKPTREEMLAAVGKTVPDVIAPDLGVLFCGINPSLYTAVVGHHFARPGNRFWKALYESGFTDRLLHPSEEQLLLSYGCGITNIAPRATAAAAEVPPAELAEGGMVLKEKVNRFSPRFLAVLGISAFRVAFDDQDAQIGIQSKQIGGTPIWVLPNPSGLNAHYPPARLAELLKELRLATFKK